VRGFDERIVAADTGHVVNLEAYTPNLAERIGIPGVLHGLSSTTSPAAATSARRARRSTTPGLRRWEWGVALRPAKGRER
jgi:hypothetical protein